MRWVQKAQVGGGESSNNNNNSNNGSPFDDYGGQLLPIDLELMEQLGEGDEIEVYYDQDREWGRAVIEEVVEYRDDTR